MDPGPEVQLGWSQAQPDPAGCPEVAYLASSLRYQPERRPGHRRSWRYAVDTGTDRCCVGAGRRSAQRLPGRSPPAADWAGPFSLLHHQHRHGGGWAAPQRHPSRSEECGSTDRQRPQQRSGPDRSRRCPVDSGTSIQLGWARAASSGRTSAGNFAAHRQPGAALRLQDRTRFPLASSSGLQLGWPGPDSGSGPQAASSDPAHCRSQRRHWSGRCHARRQPVGPEPTSGSGHHSGYRSGRSSQAVQGRRPQPGQWLCDPQELPLRRPG